MTRHTQKLFAFLLISAASLALAGGAAKAQEIANAAVSPKAPAINVVSGENRELVETLAAESANRNESAERRQRALEKCIASLHASDQRLVSLRYRDGASVIQAAKSLGRPVNSVYQSLCRIRKALVQCVLQRMASEERT